MRPRGLAPVPGLPGVPSEHARGGPFEGASRREAAGPGGAHAPWAPERLSAERRGQSAAAGPGAAGGARAPREGGGAGGEPRRAGRAGPGRGGREPAGGRPPSAAGAGPALPAQAGRAQATAARSERHGQGAAVAGTGGWASHAWDGLQPLPRTVAVLIDFLP